MAEAARQLNLSPAAVAQQVRALEKSVGLPLTRRAGRVVKLTEQGLRIAQHGAPLLRALEDLCIPEDVSSYKGELRLGAVATAMSGIVPDMLVALRKKFPGVHVSLIPGDSNRLYADTLSGELDAALVVKPSFGLPKTCDWRTLRIEPLVLLTPESIKTAAPETILSRHPLIRYDRSSEGGRIADRYLRTLAVKPEQSFELFSLSTIGILVDRGLGVSLVPDWAPPWPMGLRLDKIVIPDDDYKRHVGLIWLRHSAKYKAIAALLQDYAG